MYSKLVSEMLVNINDLLNSYRNLFTKEEYMAIKKIYFELKKSSISSIEELKNFEDRLIGYFGRAWNYYLSDFSTFKNGDDFRFVITCPTVYASDYDLKDRAFLSTSLVTNKHMGTFNRINYGIVCSVDESNLLVVSSKDVNVVGKKLDGYYLASTHGEENLYSREYVNNLQLPLEIENEMIKDNIVFNGDFIIDPNKNIYSDVSLNPKTTKFLGVILFKPYSEKDYKEASSLASKYNLILKIVDKDFYYDKISSIKYSKDKRIYDLKDLDTILYILIHIDTLLNEFNNLIIESFDLVNIKDEDTLTKISINRNLNIASIYLIDDIRYFKIDFSNGIKNALFYIDNVLVSKDIFKNELINVKSHELNL